MELLCSNPSENEHKTLQVFVCSNHIVMNYSTHQSQKAANCLLVSRINNDIREKMLVVRELHQQFHVLQFKQYYLWIGTIQLANYKYLIFVSEAKVVGRIENHVVYEISKIEWIDQSQTPRKDFLVQQIAEQITDLIQNGGYYFSLTTDLSMSKQTSKSQQQFTWNHFLMFEGRRHQISQEWLTPIIQGFVGVLNFQFVCKPQVMYVLISRRSCRRAGTRFFTRGIDDDGDVANYVETEQLIYTGAEMVSHIQIRGSVPLFWQQRGIDGIQSKLTLTRTLQTSQNSFIKHLQKIKQTYKRCFIVNLLNKDKSSEGFLTEQFQLVIDSSKNIIQDFVRYEYFNFHQVCGSSHFEKCNPLLQKIEPIIESLKYLHTSGGRVLSSQDGVVRTNCLDCLDRTNFIQAKIAITLFEKILRNLGFSFSMNLRQNMDQVQCLKLTKDFKSLWADNGDMISVHYTGMPSTHTDVTREGKRTLIGMIGHKLRSLGRFYKQFTDIHKQETINLLLGYTKSSSSTASLIEKHVRLRRNEYSIFTPTTLMVISWNVSYSSCPRRFLSKVVDLKQLPTLVVIGLQNVYQCSKLVQGGDSVIENIKDSWNSLFKSEFVNECGYTRVLQKYAHGSGLFIYFRANDQVNLWDLGGFSTTEMNFSGILDKSSEAIMLTKLKVQDSTFLFANFNFEKGTDLLEHAQDIHEKAFQHVQLGRQKEEKIACIDYKILFGFLGYTILDNNKKIQGLVSKYKSLKDQGLRVQASKILGQIAELDVICRSRDVHPYLSNYNQGPLTFLPTSSFFSQQNYHQDTTPSWSSRIMIHSSENSIVKQLLYKSVPQLQGQHLPVVSIYTLDLVKQDPQRKRKVEVECANLQM